jgi:tetratricopeptide (TPR) repeat protein
MGTWWGVLLVVTCSAVGQAARADKPAKELTPPERERLEKEAQQLDAKMMELYEAGKPVEASEYASKSLILRQKLYPAASHADGHPDLAGSLNNLGAMLLTQGRNAQAQPYYEQALAMYQKLYPKAKFPDGHPDLARSLNNFGYLLDKQGRSGQALPYYEQALAMRQRLYPAAQFPAGHPDLAQSLNNFGTLLEEQGRYVQALPYYEQALAMRQKLYPKAQFPAGHPDLAISLNNLGTLLDNLGRYGQALRYKEQTLAMSQKLYPAAKYPDGHPQLAITLNNMGYLLMKQGRYVQALPYYEQALAMQQKLYPKAKFPDGHAGLVISLNNLSFLFWDQGQYAQALPYAEQALAMCQKLYPVAKYPDGHPHLARSLTNLGALLKDQGRYAQALPYYEQALAMDQKLYPAAQFPDGSRHLAGSLNNLGLLLKAQGRYAQALPYYEQALAMQQKLYPAAKYPDGHPDLTLSLNNLGSLLTDQGRFAQALPYYAQALAMNHRQAERFAEVATESEALAWARSLPRTLDGLLSVSRHLRDSVDRTYELLWSGRDALSRIWQLRHLATLAAASRPEIRDRWAELLDTRRRLARLLLQPLPPDLVVRTARDREVQQLADRKESLERELGRSLPALAAAQRAHSRPADLQAQLPPYTAFIDLSRYIRFEQDPQVAGKAGERRTPCYVAFVVQAGCPTERVELGEAATMEQVLDAWRRAIFDRQDSPTASRLRRLAWEPLEKQLAAGTQAVYLAPDGALTRLPWAALPGRRPGTVLLEDYALGIVEHGPQMLAALRRPAVPADRTGPLLLVGGVRYDQAPAPAAPPKGQLLVERGPDRDGVAMQWNPLAGTAREVRLVKTAAGQRPVIVLDETAASVSRLLRELPQARMAHVATHGFFNERYFRQEQEAEAALVRNYAFAMGRQLVLAGQGARSPLDYTGLVLAGANVPDKAGPEGGILTGELLLEVNLEGLELAVLSACQTGLGEVAGDQVVHRTWARRCTPPAAATWSPASGTCPTTPPPP